MRLQQENDLARTNSKLSAPIHCVVGDKDPVTMGAAKHHRRWRQFSDQVDLTVIKEAGHYFLHTHPEELGQWILAQIGVSTGEQHD